jgi:hypothetical protein
MIVYEKHICDGSQFPPTVMNRALIDRPIRVTLAVTSRVSRLFKGRTYGLKYCRSVSDRIFGGAGGRCQTISAASETIPTNAQL